jgi:hypothetical protein
MVVLVGGSQGTWQLRAERQLLKVAPIVQRLAGRPLEEVLLLLDSADVVVAWCGVGPDVHYLTDWLFVGRILGVVDKVVIGVSPITDHPMAPRLRDLVRLHGLPCPESLDDVLSAAAEKCRQVRAGEG